MCEGWMFGVLVPPHIVCAAAVGLLVVPWWPRFRCTMLPADRVAVQATFLSVIVMSVTARPKS